jgi:hypothetical protein
MRAIALIYSVAFFFTMAITVNAQNIRGAEIAVKDVIGKTIYLRLFYLMETPDVRTPIIDWGDGNSSTLEYMGIGYFEEVGLYRVQYGTHYVYADTSGMFELLFQDSFLIPGVRNIDHSETRTFAIRDSIFIFPEENVLQVNIFNPTAGRRNFEINSDGTLSHQLIRLPDLLGLGWDIHSYTYEIVPFPAEGFLDTIPSEDLYIENDMLYWDKPKAPGIYALGVKMTQKGEDYSGVTDSITLSTTTIGLMFEIDEEMIVSQYEVESTEDGFWLFPNPTTSTLHLQLQRAQATQGKLQIENLAGQTLHAETLNLSPTLQSWRVDVADWPSGVYVVRLLAGAQQVVRKFVKE